MLPGPPFPMYNKLFTKILDSSVWLQSSATRIVWLTFIAVMDEHGFVQFASVGNVASRARVTREEAEIALGILEAADPDSFDQDHDGRRIERVPGGWLVLNAEKHRNAVTRAVVQAQTRERVRRFRQRLKTARAQAGQPDVTDVTETPPPVTLGNKKTPKRNGAVTHEKREQDLTDTADTDLSGEQNVTSNKNVTTSESESEAESEREKKNQPGSHTGTVDGAIARLKQNHPELTRHVRKQRRFR